MPALRYLLPLAISALLSQPAAGQTGRTLDWVLGEELRLVEIDLTTFETELLAPVGPAAPESPQAMALGPDGDYWLLGIADLQVGGTFLYRFDPRAGKLETVGEIEALRSDSPTGFTFTPDGRLLLGNSRGEPALYQVDIQTAVATPVGPVSAYFIGMTFLGDQMVALTETPGIADYSLVFYDLDTATTTPIAPFDSQLIGLGQHNLDVGSDGRLYALIVDTAAVGVASIPRALAIDLDTGAVEVLAEESVANTLIRRLGLEGVQTGTVVDVPGLGTAGRLAFLALLVIAGVTATRLRT
ncbi:MAG: hypothetical protein AAGF23_20875 [Acidobacteriota bacterium]